MNAVMKLRLLVAAAALAILAGALQAQPFNVRAWYAKGQVFVVWQFPAPPAAPTDTVEIYSSPGMQPSTALMNQEGRLFFPEYTGGRLGVLQPAATLVLPAPGGATYTLAADEGAFVYTPHAAGNRFFAVVDTGSTTVVPANSAGVAFNYDPVNDPVRPHLQFSGLTTGGYPYAAFVIWADGRADHMDARPDVPVLANKAKNGVPHVFTITRPMAPLPPGPVSCVFAMHGGGGEYQLFRPGIPARANLTLEMTDGIVVTPDDSFYANIENAMGRTNTGWFGYTPTVDPFDSAPRVAPPDGTLVVNYTQRRVHWLLSQLTGPNSPQPVDPDRVAMIGHSAGGMGTSHLTRLRPERFAAAVCQTPAIAFESGTAGAENFLRGTNDQNLPTNLEIGGVTLGVTDVLTPTTRLSETQRDFCLTRTYSGKRDVVSSASWGAEMRAILDDLNDSRMGYMISWDEREHGVEKWHTEDPTPGPDIGQWIAPVKTLRHGAQYLVDTYRASRSFPGFFNSDQQPLLSGRQPDPGPGDPDLGDPWGTWTGYCEWEGATIVDTPTKWACTIYLTGLSAASVDNCPVAEITTDVTPRRTSQFMPPESTPVHWKVIHPVSGAVLQSGGVFAEAEGVVAVTGVVVPRDPDRVVLTLKVCYADCNGDTLLNLADFGCFQTKFVLGSIYADCNGDGLLNLADFGCFQTKFAVGCP